jgi:3-hydroxyisobutyrate dehydrogenase-like beta-hydroxyacid dehydrogenase
MAAVKRSLNVGVVGLGRMGVPIVRNIAFKSRSSMYLQLHSRSLTRATEVCDAMAKDGAQCAMRIHSKYATITKWCDVVITCLADGDAARSVLLDRSDALLRNARQGQIFIDHTTLDVATAKACGEMARSRGAFYLDAPISGSPEAAFNAQLTVMLGGEEEAFTKVLGMMRLYAENVHRMGAVGTGSATKSVCQGLVAMHTVAAAEALTMAHTLGIEDKSKLFSVLDSSWGSSTMLRRNAPMMQKLVRNPEMIPTRGVTTVDSLLADINLLPASPDQALPLFETSKAILARTSIAGIGDRDVASVVHFLDSASVDVPLGGGGGAPAAGATGAAAAAAFDLGTVPKFDAAPVDDLADDGIADGTEFY